MEQYNHKGNYVYINKGKADIPFIWGMIEANLFKKRKMKDQK